jgi:hypothetical protein
MEKLHIIVWKSDTCCLAVDRGFDSAALAEEYLRTRTRISFHNVDIRPLETINSSLIDIPREDTNEAAAPL